MKVIITREDEQILEAHTLLDPTKKATTVVAGDSLYLLRPNGTVRWWPTMKTPAKNFLVGTWRASPDQSQSPASV